MERFAGSSKISPPRVQRIVYRSRLTEALDREREKQLILILGQAAQGKSTLAASWMNGLEDPFAWLNIEAEDSDPVNLFRLLVRSIQKSSSGADFSHLIEYPTISLGPRTEMSLYRDWANALFGATKSPLRIVFDGLDRLMREAPAFRFLQVLVDEAPEGVQVVALSRSMPPFDVERLRMGRQASVIDNHELAFSPEEIKAFFKDICGIALRSELVEKIHGLTEGWVGGLVLLSELLRHMDKEDALRYLSDGFAPHLKVEVFRYLGQEIFSSQPQEIQEFLTRSSILEVVEPGFVRDFLGTQHPEEILQELSDRNLFVQQVYDEKRGWLFRYHQLFQDFLNATFETETNQDERSYWFSRGGTLLEETDDLEGAIHCFLEAKAYSEAARLIKRAGMDLLKAGRTGDLSRWLQALPEDFRNEDTRLLFYGCATRRFTAVEENCQILQKIIPSLRSDEDVRGHLLALGFVIEASVARGIFKVPFVSLLEESEELLRSSASRGYPFERTMLLSLIGQAQHMTDPRRGFQTCQTAYLAATELKSPLLQISALCSAILCLSLVGEFSLAEEYCKKIDELMSQFTHPDLRSLYHVYCSWLSVYKGDLEATERHIAAAQSEIERHGLTYLYPISLMPSCVWKTYSRSYDEARQVGRIFLDTFSQMPRSIPYGCMLQIVGACCYHQGRLEEAWEYTRKALAVLSLPEARHELALNDGRVALGYIESHLEHLSDGEALVREGLRYFTETENFLRLVDAHLAMALIQWGKGNTEECGKYLLAGFGIAQDKGYTHLIVISPKDFIRCCTLALELELEEVAGYATHLLTTKFADCAGPELLRLSEHSSPAVAEKAFEIEASIHRKTAAPLRIETLGGLRVLRGDVLIEGKEWGGNQPRRFLMALICRGSRQVPHELLIDDLWPEASPDAGKKNFRINLHRLRKALEPSMNERFGSSYVHLKNNLLSLDEELCRLDVDEWIFKLEDGARREAQGDIKEALRAYREAEVLYRGDFLPEELYSGWASAARDRVQRKCLDLLSRMAQLYEMQGAFRKAVAYNRKLIQIDPTLEAAYRSIMVLHANRGMRTEALKTYEQCCKALHCHLNTEPDELTAAILKQIVNSS